MCGSSDPIGHTNAQTHSPCRDLAVVHVGSNNHACFAFVALQEGKGIRQSHVMLILCSGMMVDAKTADFHSLYCKCCQYDCGARGTSRETSHSKMWSSMLSSN